MKTREGSVLERPVARVNCKHHWLIEPANGPTSRGVCKLCGEVKVFDNILEDLLSASDSYSPFSLSGLKEEDEDGDEEGDIEVAGKKRRRRIVAL